MPSRLGGVDDEQDGMETAEVSVAVLGLLGQDTSTITKVAQGYAQDQVMGAWLQEEDRAPGVTLENVENGQGVHQVLRWEGRLCVPDTSELREGFIRQCHDDVGHFGVANIGDGAPQLLLGGHEAGCCGLCKLVRTLSDFKEHYCQARRPPSLSTSSTGEVSRHWH